MRVTVARMTAAAREESRHYDTIVLGAGMSGLSCAAKLFEQQQYRQKSSLLVLEARDRIGGRIGSVHVNGSRLDTGANWIHGVGTDQKPNPLVKVLPHKKYKELSGMVAFRPSLEDDFTLVEGERDAQNPQSDWVEVAATEPLSEPSVAQNTRKGDLVIPSEVAAPLMGALWEMIGSLHELAEGTTAAEAKRTTVLHAITETDTFREAYRQVPKALHSTFGGMPQFMESMEAAPLAAQSAEHPEDQPGMSLLEYAIDDFDGDQVFLQDGYTAVIEEVAKDLIRDEVVKLGVEVKQVKWDANPIVIETGAGTYHARQVVCTLPLGILQHHQKSTTSEVSLFQPQLPPRFREAVSHLGFGTLDKIFLVYAKPWWTQEPYLSVIKKGLVNRPFSSEAESGSPATEKTVSPDSFMGFTAELPGLAINENGTTCSGPRSLTIINLHNLTGYPVLSAFVSCANATHVESLTDKQASGILQRALTCWFGHEPPSPEAVHVTRWAQDKYSRGSYSHMITGVSETKHREAFQQPIVNDHGAVLRFAGEHTSRNHFATVHGALISGWREADGILERNNDRQ